MKSKKKSLCIIFAVALVFSVLIELGLFTVNRSVGFESGSVSLLQKEGCSLTPANYNVDGNRYGQNNVDPQLNFSGVNEDVKTVYIKFGSRIIKDTPVQIYYAEKDMDFTPDNSRRTTVTFPSKSLIMEIPEGDYASLRIDIDGDFGPITRAGVIDLQKKLFPNTSSEWDGIVGKNTWTAALTALN